MAKAPIYGRIARLVTWIAVGVMLVGFLLIATGIAWEWSGGR